jgi:hypothetical protein
VAECTDIFAVLRGAKSSRKAARGTAVIPAKAGDPVRRALTAPSQLSLEYWVARSKPGDDSSGDATLENYSLRSPSRMQGRLAHRLAARQASNCLFDDPVRACEQRRGQVDTHGVRGEEIDGELKFGGTVERQVGRLFALQYPIKL